MSEKIRLRNATCIIQCKSNVIIKVLINKKKRKKKEIKYMLYNQNRLFKLKTPFLFMFVFLNDSNGIEYTYIQMKKSIYHVDNEIWCEY